MEEIWRKVENFDRIEISSKGRLKIHNFRRSGIAVIKENLYIDNNYKKTYIVINGKPTCLFIHILVAKTFPEICGKWFKGCHVHHKDGNTLNNNADNLEILSISNHTSHHHKNTGKPVIGTSISDGHIESYHSLTIAARHFGVSKAAIYNCINGKQQCHSVKGYKWEYAKKKTTAPF